VTSPTAQPILRQQQVDVAGKTHYGRQLWAVFAALVAATLLSALDGAIVATALPTIALSLDAGPSFVWIANV